MSAIASAVANVASSTEHLINRPGTDSSLQKRSGPVLQTLDYHRHRLLDATAEAEGASSPEQLREATNKLPPIAFGIARETKELVQRLSPVQYGAEDDDFR